MRPAKQRRRRRRQHRRQPFQTRGSRHDLSRPLHGCLLMDDRGAELSRARCQLRKGGSCGRLRSSEARWLADRRSLAIQVCEVERVFALGGRAPPRFATVDKLRVAEGEGFEPPVPFRVQWFSRPPPSTARPSLRFAILVGRTAIASVVCCAVVFQAIVLTNTLTYQVARA